MTILGPSAGSIQPKSGVVRIYDSDWDCIVSDEIQPFEGECLNRVNDLKNEKNLLETQQFCTAAFHMRLIFSTSLVGSFSVGL